MRYESIGDRIGKRRAELGGMTQKQLAEKIGETREHIAAWEKGRNLVKSEDIPKLCKALECTADYLVGIDDLPNKDMDRSTVAKYTGLSGEAITKLHNLVMAVERLEEIAISEIDLYKKETKEEITQITGVEPEQGFYEPDEVLLDQCFLRDSIYTFLNALIKSEELEEISYNACRFYDEEDYYHVYRPEDAKDFARYKCSTLINKVCEKMEREKDFEKSFTHTDHIRVILAKKNVHETELFEPIKAPIHDPEEV